MPSLPQKPCNYPGCKNLIREGRYCAIHRRILTARRNKQIDKQRPNSGVRGYGSKWQRYRKGFLLRNPLCVVCMQRGRVTTATVVDHIKPHKGDMGLFWAPDNHQALCKRCHDRKTVIEDGGFGRQRKDKDDAYEQ